MLKIVSWNLEGRLSDLSRDGRGTPEKIVDAIEHFDADVLVHPEAYGTKPGMSPAIRRRLKALGYVSVSTAYDDATGRGDRESFQDPHVSIMTRLPIVRHEVIRPGDIRNMLSVTVTPPWGGELRVIGVHLEDRSEALRLRQVGPLADHINSSLAPTVVMGDFNAMPPDTARSRFVASAGFRMLAHAAPTEHMRYTMTRLSEMASGRTIAGLLENTDLRNTDPGFSPTTTPKMRKMEWMPSIRFAKIDWILASPDLAYRNFAVSRDLGSDHRALSLEIVPADTQKD